MENAEWWVVAAMVVIVMIGLVRKGGLKWRAKPETVEQAFRGAASRLGLEYELVSGERQLSGELDGFHVLVETFKNTVRVEREDEQPYTRIVLNGRGRVPPELTISGESGWSAAKKLVGKQDVQLGDPAFDDAVLVDGPEDVALASLRQEARPLVAALVREGGSVREGDLHLKWPDIVDDVEVLERGIRSMVETAKAMTATSVPDALAVAAATEADAPRRERCLRALVAHHAAAPQTPKALETALADSSPGVRLVAAANLAPDARVRGTLEALLQDSTLPSPLRAEALSHLGDGFPPAETAAAVATALQDPAPEVQRAAVRVACRSAIASVLPQLLAKVTGADRELALELARGLPAFDTGVEDALVGLLAHDDVQVQAAAAQSLEKAGSIRAVEPLLARSQGLTTDAALKEAARSAIRAIQGRAAGAGVGQLSVVETAAAEGALSLVPPAVAQRE